MSLDKSKLALIHVARKQLGMEEDVYRAMLFHVAGVNSSRDLDDTGFDLIMRHFETIGFQSDWNRANLGYRRGMASPGQVALLRDLWSTFTSGTGTDASLGKWLEGRFKVSALRFLTAEVARKAIGALQKMTAKTGRAKADRPAPAA